MESSRSMQALKDGCCELGMDFGVAKELLRLLVVKRSMGPVRGAGLGQSSSMDELLHWLLLNTDAREIVEEEVGRITHKTRSEDTEEIKAEKRLRSLNVLSKDGWQPQLAFWREAGTVVENIKQITLSHDLTGESSTLYYTDDHGHEAIELLLRNPGHTSYVHRLHRQLEADEQEFLECMEGRARKRQRTEDGACGGGDEWLHTAVPLKVKDLSGETYICHVRATTTGWQLKKVIESIQGIYPDQQRLFCAGRQLDDKLTLAENRVRPDSILHVVQRLRGC